MPTPAPTLMPSPAPVVSDSNGNVYPIDPSGKVACAVLNMNHLVEEYVDKTECYSVAERRARIRMLLLEAARALEYQKIEYWLDSSSLAGAVRERDVSPDDVDAAIGLTQASMDQLRHSRLITLHPRYALFLKDSPHYRDGPFPYPSGRFVDTQTGLYTNIFEFFPSRQPASAPISIATGTLGAELMPLTKGNVTEMLGPVVSPRTSACKYCADGGHFNVLTDWVFPLQPCSIDGTDVVCPARSDKYLTLMYGDMYMDE
ncbi:hypothetical protein SPRG_01359 [Saprolegnia parasitica CBS 223.65]|uniref:Uncharacterized protein n=1 Tax=Saprolegnia parasitica (strain CBS 223.65) TaxID=695850 RepID=A0A067CXV2_SAPPC|nr:hypothetical protein SPRG_01359 [Saprolegnia parasitica CBS 223.65]KDO34085.1 hypothetical protein SPRG_01359 [Saprolegnia parasitica CBS 223.65]|eukprot:XP_012194969.1 hypothetical protein SPRG_01359 [Saprolegnia parasitica CBS 223.65]